MMISSAKNLSSRNTDQYLQTRIEAGKIPNYRPLIPFNYDKWPISIHVLDDSCNISGPTGNKTEGYPNGINEWLRFDMNNYLEEQVWFCTYNRLLEWTKKYKTIPEDPPTTKIYRDDITSISHRLTQQGKDLYNLAWALHGYILNQEEWIVDLAFQLPNDSLFQEIEVVKSLPLAMPTIRDRQSRRTVKHAKKEKTFKPKGRPQRIKINLKAKA